MSACGTGTPAVQFSYAAWTARYPELAGVSEPSAELYFAEATLYCANRLGPVPTTQALLMLLNMLTAHIAALNSPVTASGQNPLTPPGRLSSVTEGSVSASFTNDYPPGTPQWFQQTKYGAAYWQATLPYRLFRYRPKTFGPASLSQVPWLYPNTGG
jgi:hypothetical protein